MPLLALAITDDASRSALLSTHPIQGQQCAEAPLDPGGATKQLPTRRYLALEGGLTAEPAWAVERRRRRPQEHGWASQRAVARRGGPGGPDAGRAFVSLSTSSASVRCPVSGVRCPVSGASDQCPRLPVHGTGVQCPVRAFERPGVRCPASGVGVRCLFVAASAVSGRSEVLERGVGRPPYGWDGRGRRGRPLRPCPARRLPESAPRLEAGAGGAGPAEASVWAWPSSWEVVGSVASSTAWPIRIGRVHARIVRWWEPVRSELASCGRLISMGRANRSAGLAGRAQHQEANRTHPVSKAELNSSSIYQTLLNLFWPFSPATSSSLRLQRPIIYPHMPLSFVLSSPQFQSSTHPHLRCTAAAWWQREGRTGWRCR
jgi:hypothetical protein